MKKVTLKDIAEHAGVSVAAVSYVLNNRTDQKISIKTREKVLEVAYELNYVPNIAARTLANRKSSLIGIVIVISDNEDPWEKFLYTDFVRELEKVMSKNNYDVIVSTISVSKPQIDIISKRELEGVFLINVKGDMFYKLSTKISAPLVVVDSLIQDNYFYKITWNFSKAIASIKKNYDREDIFLVTSKFNNKEFMEYVRNDFNQELVYEVDSTTGLSNFLEKNKDRKGIIINEFIGDIASRFIDNKNICVITICGSEYLLAKDIRTVIFSNKKKAVLAANQLFKLIKEQYDDNTYIYVNHNKPK
ncbi:hypothetical protein AN1V17_14600 [Vallitalea sediminicola]